MIRSAEIEGEYRYLLQRTWSAARRLLIIMLNPSMADAQKEDPTLLRCIQFAQSWGFGGIDVVNAFALISSNPKVMAMCDDPIGPRCNEFIEQRLDLTDAYLLAWGSPPEKPTGLRQRVKLVEEWVLMRARERNVPVYCLGRTMHGFPKHPLARGVHRVPDNQKPILYTEG